MVIAKERRLSGRGSRHVNVTIWRRGDYNGWLEEGRLRTIWIKAAERGGGGGGEPTQCGFISRMVEEGKKGGAR